MKLNKEHIQLMKKCLGIKIFLRHNITVKRNRFNYFWCKGIEEIKLWNDICRCGFAEYRYPEKSQAYYFLTIKGIEFLEMKLGVQIKI